jgi:lipopolysaccharide export system permease protein
MVIDRYILRQWLTPFVSFVGIVVSVLLLSRMLRVLGDLIDKDVQWHIMLNLMSALMPYFLMLALPMGSFFAMLSLVHRLQHSSELDAFRAAGISYLRLFRSLIAVTVILWLFLSYVSIVWVPIGQKTFMDLLDSIRHSKALPAFDPQRFNTEMPDFTVYVDGVDSQGIYHGFMLADNRAGGPVVYIAESAQILRDGGLLRFVLHHGHRLEGQGENLRSVAFDEYRVALDVGKLGFERMDFNRGVLQWGMNQLWRAFHTRHNPSAEAEWNRRLVIPTMVLLFPLFVLPMGLELKRSGRTGMYISAVALVLLAYNVHLALYQKVAAGMLSGWWIWVPQVVLALVGLDLTRRRAQDRLPPLMMVVEEFFTSIHLKIQARLGRRWE